MDKKILIIEDDIDILSNVDILLRENGYRTLLAEDGYTGLSIAKNDRPDMVICDIMMPGINGYEVFDEFAGCDKLKIIPFIFLTAKAEKHDFRKGMELGADDYVVKPFSAMDLLNSVKARLRRVEILRSSASGNEEKKLSDRYGANDKLYVRVNGKPQFLKINQIICITSDRQYTSLKYLNGRNFVMRKSISNWESILPKDNFIRIHRSTIINFDMVEKIENSGNAGMKIFLKNHEEPFTASKRYSSKLKKNLK